MNKKNKKFNKCIKDLNALYRSIPDTKGCMEHINKPKEEGGCGSFCCQTINPHVMNIEFQNTWNYILNKYSWEDICNIIEKAIRNYLSTNITKGCIFFNKDSGLCGCHDVRSLECRLYGINPEEDIKPRIERLRVLYKDKIGAVFRDQCNLVSTVDGTKVTQQMTRKWHDQLSDIEEENGIKKSDQFADKGGSYMTYHDSLLLHTMPDFVMKQLQILRVNGSFEEKEKVIAGIINGFRRRVFNDQEKSSLISPIKNTNKS